MPSLSLWLTDGSLPIFTDTVRLDASHPAPLGLSTRYEGLVDPAVPVGEAVFAAALDGDVLFVEAEWWVSFPEGIDRYLADPGAVGPDTPVVLQAMVEGKWMNRLLDTRAWRPASVGNNVVAAGPGIVTTLGGAHRCGAAARIDYDDLSGRPRSHRTTAGDLAGHNVVALVRDVVRTCSEGGEPIDGINLGAVGEDAAVVNERARIRAARNLRPHRAKEILVRQAIADGLGVAPDTPVVLATVDAAEVAVGEGRCRWAEASV